MHFCAEILGELHGFFNNLDQPCAWRPSQSSARREPAIYSVATVEPGVCKMLYEQAVLMGFEGICLAKCRNNTINLDMTDDMCREEAHESSPQ